MFSDFGSRNLGEVTRFCFFDKEIPVSGTAPADQAGLILPILFVGMVENNRSGQIL